MYRHYDLFKVHSFEINIIRMISHVEIYGRNLYVLLYFYYLVNNVVKQI